LSLTDAFHRLVDVVAGGLDVTFNGRANGSINLVCEQHKSWSSTDPSSPKLLELRLIIAGQILMEKNLSADCWTFHLSRRLVRREYHSELVNAPARDSQRLKRLVSRTARFWHFIVIPFTRRTPVPVATDAVVEMQQLAIAGLAIAFERSELRPKSASCSLTKLSMAAALVIDSCLEHIGSGPLISRRWRDDMLSPSEILFQDAPTTPPVGDVDEWESILPMTL